MLQKWSWCRASSFITSGLWAGTETTTVPFPICPVPVSVPCIYALAGPPHLLLSPSLSQRAGNNFTSSFFCSFAWPQPPSQDPSLAKLFWSDDQVLTSTAWHSISSPTTFSICASPSLPSLPKGLKGKRNNLFNPMKQAKHLYIDLYATQKSSLA